jgi:hypothetical protein
LKGKPSVRIVDLERRTPKIGKHRRGWFQTELFDNRWQAIEGLVRQPHPSHEDPQPLVGAGERSWITVQADQPKARLRSKQSLGMPSQTNRDIDEETGGRR